MSVEFECDDSELREHSSESLKPRGKTAPQIHFILKATEALSPAERDATPSELFFDPTFIIPVGTVTYHTEGDHSVTDECDFYDGQVFDFDDPYKPLLPLHPNCRCWYEYTDTGEKVHFSGSEWEGF